MPRVGPAPPRVGRRAREAGGSPRVPLVRRQGRRVGPLARVDERDRRAFARRWMTTSSAYLVSAARAPCNDLHDITSRITTRPRVGVTDHVTDHYPNASGSRPSNVRDEGALGVLDREHADEPPRQVSVEQKPHAGVASRRSRSAANSSPARSCRSVSSGSPRRSPRPSSPTPWSPDVVDGEAPPEEARLAAAHARADVDQLRQVQACSNRLYPAALDHPRNGTTHHLVQMSRALKGVDARAKRSVR